MAGILLPGGCCCNVDCGYDYFALTNCETGEVFYTDTNLCKKLDQVIRYGDACYSVSGYAGIPEQVVPIDKSQIAEEYTNCEDCIDDLPQIIVFTATPCPQACGAADLETKYLKYNGPVDIHGDPVFPDGESLSGTVEIDGDCYSIGGWSKQNRDFPTDGDAPSAGNNILCCECVDCLQRAWQMAPGDGTLVHCCTDREVTITGSYSDGSGGNFSATIEMEYQKTGQGCQWVTTSISGTGTIPGFTITVTHASWHATSWGYHVWWTFQIYFSWVDNEDASNSGNEVLMFGYPMDGAFVDGRGNGDCSGFSITWTSGGGYSIEVTGGCGEYVETPE